MGLEGTHEEIGHRKRVGRRSYCWRKKTSTKNLEIRTGEREGKTKKVQEEWEQQQERKKMRKEKSVVNDKWLREHGQRISNI